MPVLVVDANEVIRHRQNKEAKAEQTEFIHMGATPNVQSNFNWIAPVYDALALVVFGRRLQRAQIVWLNRIPAGSSVLIVGGGTGWLLEQILLRCQPKRVLYLETSAQMLTRASRRMTEQSVVGSVEFRVGDQTSLQLNEQFDVILTPFVLDLFTETTLQTSFIPQLLDVLKPGGFWIVTDFVQTDVWWQKALLWSMIRFFRLTTGMEARQLADWQRLFTESGLLFQEGKLRVNGMVSAEVWTRRQQS